jgi:predicted transcriptional regulator
MLYDKSKLKAIRLLVFTDKTKKEIAQELDITEQTLYNWLKERDFNNLLHSESRVYFSYIRKQTFKKLNSLLIKAFSVIENSLNSKALTFESYKLKLKSAFDILSLYANFKELNLLDEKNLNELSELIENSNSEYSFDLEKKLEAQDFLEHKDLTELLGFEDETKTEDKTEVKTSADISKLALTNKKTNENI